MIMEEVLKDEVRIYGEIFRKWNKVVGRKLVNTKLISCTQVADFMQS